MTSQMGPVVRTEHGTYLLTLTRDHREVIAHMLKQLRDSLTTTIDDSALRRLFPTAYHDDAKKDAEYQRLMREELLASRLAAIETALNVISGRDELTDTDIDAFARSINSLRLVLGTTLDIAESDYDAREDPDDHHGDQHDDHDDELIQRELYEYLGWLLEWTVGAQSEGL